MKTKFFSLITAFVMIFSFSVFMPMNEISVNAVNSDYVAWSDLKSFNVLSDDNIGYVMNESEAAGKTIPDGDYYIYSGLNRYYYLDIPGDYISVAGANVKMWYNSISFPTEYDVWTVTYCDNGFYEIKQKSTDLCLDVLDASLNRGANVQLGTKNDTVSQQWSIAVTEYGYTLQARCNAFYLDVVGGEVESDTNAQVWTGDNTKAQAFCFIPYNNDERPIEDGVYNIQSACSQDYYLDASGDYNYTNGSNIQIWNGATDKFRVEYAGEGWYKIFEVTSNLAVNVNADEDLNYIDNQRNINLYDDTECRNQLWKIRKTSDGYYFIISQLNGYYLDLLYGSCENGTNVSTVYYIGGNPQKWNFVKSNCEVNFNANGGNTSVTSKTVTYNETYGALPEPSKQGYKFEGWYTKEDGGTEITSDTIVTATSDHTLYAHWTLIPATTTNPILSGDTNDDGQIDIADVVAVASYVGDSKKNPLSNDKIIAGDVHNTGDGLTANDALMIQQYISGIITKF